MNDQTDIPVLISSSSATMILDPTQAAVESEVFIKQKSGVTNSQFERLQVKVEQQNIKIDNLEA